MHRPLIVRSIILPQAPTNFLGPIPLRVTYTPHPSLACPLEWKVIYVGSANSEQHDQTLECFETHPTGSAEDVQFELECQPPNPALIPRN